jgi:alkaline phosphatase
MNAFAQFSVPPTLIICLVQLSFKTAGDYTAKLKYYKGQETIARWTVRKPAKKRKARNVILFIGDGMTQPMVGVSLQFILRIFLSDNDYFSQITAARLIAHKSINGKYQSLMQLDKMDNLGQ